MTVPFIMSLGVGVAAVRSGKKSGDDSFGLVALSSIGPIRRCSFWGLFIKRRGANIPYRTSCRETTQSAFIDYGRGLRIRAGSVRALSPIGLFVLTDNAGISPSAIKVIIELIYVCRTDVL
ncbi:MAG: DUF1538 family protein [Christensenellaceae bacterium]